ncbi:alpha/beta hydrolase [Ramlibacter solisilvae]|uniref:Alpha/beta hydrolase n=1 Tax=Ramlibacter tataouinensis TaxID=94132 RepID=A0A127JTA7_9BURK|nr:alpha/beta hydrolase [Ramlibacter tataouinensis]AMO23187.1 alpha/beta hydrolase [Ramlibacter tataouinensis]
MSIAHSESTLSTFTASDGDNLAMQDWPAPEGLAARGTVLLVHGLGEHAGRYEHVARRLNSWGFAVRGYDQYGHGESGGERGALPDEARLIDDLADVIESTRKRMEPQQPLILLGHSMGGLVAACLAAIGQVRIDGLVLSSPLFDPGLSAFQRFLVATLPRVAPTMTVSNGVDPNFISRDPDVVAAYRTDARVHNRVSARLARFIAEAGPMVVEHAPEWTVPTLLMYAGGDRLVDPAGSEAFAQAAPPQVVSTHCFAGHYHEIFNEPDKEPVFSTLRLWLDSHFDS